MSIPRSAPATPHRKERRVLGSRTTQIGNLTSGGGRTLTWTSYNYPASVTRGGNTVTFQYGPNRQRITETGPGYTRTTVNAWFEKVQEGSNIRSNTFQ